VLKRGQNRHSQGSWMSLSVILRLGLRTILTAFFLESSEARLSFISVAERMLLIICGKPSDLFFDKSYV
jgi:hypothetical protein